MPTYSPQELGYDLFSRSPEAPRFENFSCKDTFICWMDILGVKNMKHNKVVSTIKHSLTLASESSSTGFIGNFGDNNFKIFLGTPQTAIQYTIVGDAIVLVEKEQPDSQGSATLGLIYRANLLSRFLFQSGYVHRGVITKGSVHCEKFDDTNIITGKGIVEAFNLEKNIQVSGLFFDQKVLDFINSGRQSQINRHSFCAQFYEVPRWDIELSPGLSGVCFSQYDGWKYWNEAILNSDKSFPNIQNAITLIDELRLRFTLPSKN